MITKKNIDPVKKLEVHPNVIIRKKLKSKAKLGAMLIQIYDEQVAGVYPTCTHRELLQKYGLHNYAWNNAFSGISKKRGNSIYVTIPEEGTDIMQWAQRSMEHYKSSPQWAKNMIENVCLNLLRK